MKKSKNGLTIESVNFKVKNGINTYSVIEAANKINPILKQMDGFIERKLSKNEEGIWTDLILWETLDKAFAAADKIMTSVECSSFFEVIDEDSVQINHSQELMYFCK